MATKKKTSKHSRTKKPASKKPIVKAAVNKPAAPVAARPAPAKSQPGWAQWIPALVVVVPLLVAVVYMVNRPADTTAPDQLQNTTGSPSSLRVVPGQEAGTSSNQASGALQPQAAGLQQSQPTAQSAGGLNLQAQTTSNQTTIH